jgi:energy-coupling factor transporter transmembrane protein EcfT
MHPGARILLAILSALALPGLSFFYLAVLSSILLALALPQPGRLAVLFRRSRWLLAGMVLVYAWQLPGAPLIESLAWSPTQPGVEAGLIQAWRLAAMLLLIDLLILRLPAEALLAGVASLLWPLRAFGLPADRITLRLGLTLHALGNPLPHRRRLLADAEATALALPDAVILNLPAWRLADGLILSLAGLTLGGLWLAA